MPRVIDLGRQRALLDIASYGRRGPGEKRTLTVGEVAFATRTARGVPEVVVKVSGGATTTKGARAHLDYIGREGEQEIETDDGRRISEYGFERQIVKDWDLDLEERKGGRQRAITTRREPPKLVHNLIFSMPQGTPAEKVRKAVREFAREKFALQHRYLMTLHTDQPQPHVHLVVKAVSEHTQKLADSDDQRIAPFPNSRIVRKMFSTSESISRKPFFSTTAGWRLASIGRSKVVGCHCSTDR